MASSDTIYDALRESHERQRALCRQLLETEPHGSDRRKVFVALRNEEAAHAAAEERFLYAPILMDDNGLQPSRHALAEHHKLEELFEELDGRDPSEAGWMQRAGTLVHELEHHLEEEETRFFQQSGKILSDTAKVRLAAAYREDYARMLAQQPGP
ncbi:MAG: hemerythrin domain-containing protein [Pseudoxanthomonas suwonensis]|nr:hemerythrin domain-containing protein [Pseudoxanthomonas suwonensis]